jgi:hypothetical protein
MYIEFSLDITVSIHPKRNGKANSLLNDDSERVGIILFLWFPRRVWKSVTNCSSHDFLETNETYAMTARERFSSLLPMKLFQTDGTGRIVSHSYKISLSEANDYFVNLCSEVYRPRSRCRLSLIG